MFKKIKKVQWTFVERGSYKRKLKGELKWTIG